MESRIVGFIFIWVAVIVYSIDEIKFRKNIRKTAPFT
jgi:EamA domain-containing membrane protein RarD